MSAKYPNVAESSAATAPGMLSQTELAQRWSVSEATLERWRCTGIGPVYLKLGGQVRYRLADVEAFERQSTRQGTGVSAAASGSPHDRGPTESGR